MDMKPYTRYLKLELSRCLSLGWHRIASYCRDSCTWDEYHDTGRRILGKDSYYWNSCLCSALSYDRKLSWLLDREMVWARDYSKVWRLFLTRKNRNQDTRKTNRKKWILVYRPLKISQLYQSIYTIYRLSQWDE